MIKTEKLKLPIYNEPATDKFDLREWNEANMSLEKAYSEILTTKEEVVAIKDGIVTSNPEAELVNARKDYPNLGARLDDIVGVTSRMLDDKSVELEGKINTAEENMELTKATLTAEVTEGLETFDNKIGNMFTLETSKKGNIVEAINETNKNIIEYSLPKVGDIKMFSKNPGSSWVKCDGTLVDKAFYPELAEHIKEEVYLPQMRYKNQLEVDDEKNKYDKQHAILESEGEIYSLQRHISDKPESVWYERNNLVFKSYSRVNKSFNKIKVLESSGMSVVKLLDWFSKDGFLYLFGGGVVSVSNRTGYQVYLRKINPKAGTEKIYKKSIASFAEDGVTSIDNNIIVVSTIIKENSASVILRSTTSSFKNKFIEVSFDLDFSSSTETVNFNTAPNFAPIPNPPALLYKGSVDLGNGYSWDIGSLAIYKDWDVSDIVNKITGVTKKHYCFFIGNLLYGIGILPNGESNLFTYDIDSEVTSIFEKPSYLLDLNINNLIKIVGTEKYIYSCTDANAVPYYYLVNGLYDENPLPVDLITLVSKSSFLHVNDELEFAYFKGDNGYYVSTLVAKTNLSVPNIGENAYIKGR